MPPIDPVCIAWAPVISWVVDFIKRFPWIGKYPQFVAFFVTLAVAYLNAHPSPGGSIPLSQIVVCVLLMLTTAQVTHEMISEPTGISTALSGYADKPGDAERNGKDGAKVS